MSRVHWNDFGRARAELGELLHTAQAAGRGREVAAAHMQLALVLRALGQTDAEVHHLNACLVLGHRMGLMRCLLDASSHVAPALHDWLAQPEAARQPVLAFYANRLIKGAEQVQQLRRQLAPGQPAPGIQVLTEREQGVLALVGQAMPNKKIARSLDVSPHTVKFHLRNIYDKLGVSTRDEALAQWRRRQPSPAAGGATP